VSRVITFSSTFGTGGSVIATRVAETLGWALHNRAIPVEVAARLTMPLEEALSKDEAADSRIGRLLARFSVQLAPEAGAHIPVEVFAGDEPFRKHSDDVIRFLAARSDCVIVGRAAAIVLGDTDDTLHIRLDGPREKRILQASEALKITRQEAAKRLDETDRARALYVTHFYARDWAAPHLYHVVLNSTAMSLTACGDIVLTAARDRFGTPDLRA
jgi:cytidylate kinase